MNYNTKIGMNKLPYVSLGIEHFSPLGRFLDLDLSLGNLIDEWVGQSSKNSPCASHACLKEIRLRDQTNWEHKLNKYH